ncbi:MAG TPA: TonB-dependent receptor, partial [Novosphingobium sp.]|nr:TonB-dependent receptor [Novosphingobium sp.]
TVLNMAIFDIQRVEVLRGPQGTLYGRNSTGGAVNFITRKPGDHFALNASATYGNFNQVILDGGVDIPLGDVGGLRLAGFYRSHDGYSLHKNPAFSPTSAYVPYKGNRSDNDDTGGGRVSLRLKPASNLTVDAALEYVAQTIVPAAQAWADLTSAANNPGANPAVCGNGWVSAGLVGGAPACIPQNTNLLAQVDRHTYNSPVLGIGFLHQTSTAARGRLAWDLGPATLTYTGGYRFSRNTNTLTLSPAFTFQHFGETVKTQSHELRLNGTTGGVKWQGGMFYFREIQGTNGGLYTPFVGPNGSYVNYFQHPTDTKSISGFAQIEVPLSDTLTAVAGGRYTHDTRDGTYLNYNPFFFVFGGGTGTFNTGPVDLNGKQGVYGASKIPLHYSGSKFTWMGGLNYQPNASLLIYGKVSTGYKAGGFDGTGSTFRPEKNTAYEAGAKYKFGPNTLNLAGFYYDYKDLQNDVLLNPVTGAQTFNAGKAKIYGVEVETTLRPTSDDTITATANWLHANYGQFLASVNYYNEPGNTAPTIDLAGRRLPQTPNWVLTLGYDHVFHLGSLGTLTASAFTRYKGDYFLDFYNYNDSHQSAHTQTDLSLEYKPENKRFGVQAFVRNLEDYRSAVFAQNIVVPGQANIYNWQFAPPRTYGVRLSVDF